MGKPLIYGNKEVNIPAIKQYALKHPTKHSDLYLCFVSSASQNIWAMEKGYALAEEDSWGIYDESQNGFKWAIERYPYFHKVAK